MPVIKVDTTGCWRPYLLWPDTYTYIVVHVGEQSSKYNDIAVYWTCYIINRCGYRYSAFKLTGTVSVNMSIPTEKWETIL